MRKARAVAAVPAAAGAGRPTLPVQPLLPPFPNLSIPRSPVRTPSSGSPSDPTWDHLAGERPATERRVIEPPGREVTSDELDDRRPGPEESRCRRGGRAPTRDPPETGSAGSCGPPLRPDVQPQDHETQPEKEEEVGGLNDHEHDPAEDQGRRRPGGPTHPLRSGRGDGVSGPVRVQGPARARKGFGQRSTPM